MRSQITLSSPDGEARADAFGPELVARSDDAWRMWSKCGAIYLQHVRVYGKGT